MSSYLNIVTFLLTTTFYYVGIKPALKYEIMLDHKRYLEYIKSSYIYASIYLLLVIIIQFMVNTYIISSNCGGSITQNLGFSGFYTFLPWIFIFGVIIIVLKVYPGFKSVFSDVVGYFYVSQSANKIIANLLIDKDVQDTLDKSGDITSEEKKSLQDAADAIIKICGNVSILINQIVPSNFDQYWQELKPLMKETYQNDAHGETIAIKKELFDLVVSRDNVGEAMWYIYMGVLLTAIVQLQITTKGCANNPATMEQNYKTFLANEQTAQQAQTQAQSTTYTIS